MVGFLVTKKKVFYVFKKYFEEGKIILQDAKSFLNQTNESRGFTK